jgi:hypothetical protein
LLSPTSGRLAQEHDAQFYEEAVPQTNQSSHIQDARRPAFGQWNFKIKELRVSPQSAPSLADFFHAAVENLLI